MPMSPLDFSNIFSSDIIKKYMKTGMPEQQQSSEEPSFMGSIKTVLSDNPSIGQYLLGMGAGIAGNANLGFGNALGKGIAAGDAAAMNSLENQRSDMKDMQQYMLQQHLARQERNFTKEEERQAIKDAGIAEAKGKLAYFNLLPKSIKENIPGLKSLLTLNPEKDYEAINEIGKAANSELVKVDHPIFAKGDFDTAFNTHDPTQVLQIGGGPTNITPTTGSNQSAPMPMPASTGSNPFDSIQSTNGSAPSINTAHLPGESEPEYLARMRAANDAQQQNAISVENQRQEGVKNAQANTMEGIQQENRQKTEMMKVETPIMVQKVVDQPATYDALDRLNELSRLATKTNTGAIAGSEIGQTIRNLVGDEDFQTLQAGARGAALAKLKNKLGAQVSNSDVDMILKSIFDPTKEASVNVDILHKMTKGILKTAEQDRKAMNDYQSRYKQPLSGYNPADYSKYHDYPKSINIGGKNTPIDSYDPSIDAYLINGKWVKLQKKAQ